MIVPQHWAEARLQNRVHGRQVTVRRFGWSDASLEDAQANAESRAREAMDRVIAGEKLARRERKTAYNGAEGVPIREEVLDRHGDAVITRNLYGARCLNTPNVLFADIDFQYEPSVWVWLSVAIPLLIGAGIAGWILGSWKIGLASGLVALLSSGKLASALYKLLLFAKGGTERIARTRIDAFIRKHPDWHLRLYRTPAGFRILAMHRTFDPSEEAVAQCFQHLGTDPIYARMCFKQHCFRARVSPKPWRVGISAHIRPRPGVWPINPAHMPERTQWVDAYERTASGYAACRYIGSLGGSKVDPTASAVQLIHDQLCKANSLLPIA